LGRQHTYWATLSLGLIRCVWQRDAQAEVVKVDIMGSNPGSMFTTFAYDVDKEAGLTTLTGAGALLVFGSTW
jgi:aspartate 1-decarboxylase